MVVRSFREKAEVHNNTDVIMTLFIITTTGALVMDYLFQNTSTAKEYCKGIIPEEYDSFNLVVGQLRCILLY